MIQLHTRPVLLKLALAAMWIALLVLVWLQFRSSAELGQAYEDRLDKTLNSSAAAFRSTFQDDLGALCRTLQLDSPVALAAAPASPIPYAIYEVDASLESLTRRDALSSRSTSTPWTAEWSGFREELGAAAEDLATATPRRWFNRPWLVASTVPAVFRAISGNDLAGEESLSPRFQGFLIVMLDTDGLSERYFKARHGAAFAANIAESRAIVTFNGNKVFDSHPSGGASSRNPVSLDLTASTSSRTIFRSASDGSPWLLRAEPLPGALDAAVSALRIRNLATGLTVCLVLLAGTLLLAQATRRAEHFAKMQSDFVAGFSHELRTPVTAISMLAGNLRDGLLSEPDQIRQYGELILAQSNRLRSRIEDILGFAAGRSQSLALQPVAIPEMIESVLRDESALLKGFQVETRMDPDLPSALADPVVLKSCMSNLVSNSAKYAAKAAWIGITVTDGAGGTIAITVADRGPGIAAADLSQIFEPFFRGREARTGGIPGSGLGLHLVRTRIEAMGGSVSIESQPGKGTALTVLLRSTTS